MQSFIPCSPRLLRPELRGVARKRARQARPDNEQAVDGHHSDAGGPTARLAVVERRRWHTQGVHLTVEFLDDPPAELINRILSHMNSWGDTADVRFVHTRDVGDVRIARLPNDGHWSLVGTDILVEHKDQPTMNLDGFTLSTSESELRRVVRHETGHTLGFPHEHMRREIIDRIDPEEAIRYFEREFGWDRDDVWTQVLTPLEERSIIGTTHADDISIMTYQLPGQIMKDRKPVPGGADISRLDREFIATIYPKRPQRAAAPPRLPRPESGGHRAAMPPPRWNEPEHHEHHGYGHDEHHEHHGYGHDEHHEHHEHRGLVSRREGGVLYFTQPARPEYVASVVSELERKR
ncbi:MAG: M12 family metallopeptidase [Myxococcota bacterium]